ncbi:hypothetical protein CRUP_038709 [Coryphaenoides rupestris]|nr:hypothetical protein CRUP_038709 [Coryphaenoides rupestris]
MSTDGNLPDLRFPQTGGQGNSIHLSANTLKQHGRNGEIRIAFMLYKHIGAYLSTENASVKLGNQALATNHSVIVNSPRDRDMPGGRKDETQAARDDRGRKKKTKMVEEEEEEEEESGFDRVSVNEAIARGRQTETFAKCQVAELSSPWLLPPPPPPLTCLKWRDCRLLATNRTHTTCSCTHLTNFAVLMAHVEVKAVEEDVVVEEVVAVKEVVLQGGCGGGFGEAL